MKPSFSESLEVWGWVTLTLCGAIAAVPHVAHLDIGGLK